jgi:hypothetical protein
MARIQKLPVGQVSARLQAAAVTADSARIDSEIGQAFFTANGHTFPARPTAAALAPWRHAEAS